MTETGQSRPVGSPAAAPARVQASAVPVLVAWTAGLLVSNLPQVVLREALGQRPHAWLGLVPLVAAALLLVSALLLAELVPLRGFALVLLLVSVGQLVVGLIGSRHVYSRWTAGAPAGVSFALANDLKLVPVGLVAAGLAP